MSTLPDLSGPFFSGIAGSGMSALAQMLAFRASRVAGSDRSFDQGREAAKRAYFESLGISLHPQDGSGLSPRHSCLVVSTAIEAGSPEIRRAAELGLPVIHRSDLLARLAAEADTVAVAGTSGKSTVTAMIYHVLQAAGLEPSLVTGANLLALKERGLLGNAAAGRGRWMVIEADESDGSLVKYHPRMGVILNVEKDHQPLEELEPLFRRFKSQVRGPSVLNEEDPRCRALLGPGDRCFASGGTWEGPIEDLRLDQWSSSFRHQGVGFRLRVPGAFNVANAMAALAAGRALGVSIEDCARGLERYLGLERRFQKIGVARGVTVIDDFAHNPAKIRACLSAARNAVRLQGLPEARILAVFHPHGFAPMKLMRDELAPAFAQALSAGDKLYMPEIYYAGGTAEKSLSAADLVGDVNRLLPVALFLPDKRAVAQEVVREARPGDWVVSMGARDPSLPAFAAGLLEAL